MSGTFTPTGDIVTLDKGYMVSMRGYETITDEITEGMIEAYKELAKRLGKYYGIWENDGKYYLDISQHFTCLTSALQFARVNKQLAIYDLKLNKSIYL